MCSPDKKMLAMVESLCDQSRQMNKTIDDFLERTEEMAEDIEDLAMTKDLELSGLSVLGEIKERLNRLKKDMNLLSILGLNSDLGVTSKAITNLETTSLEMFTRLAKLESLHIIPGLDSTMKDQLARWGKWQEAAEALKTEMNNFY